MCLRCVCLSCLIDSGNTVSIEVDRIVSKLNLWSKILQFQLSRSWTPCRTALKNSKKESDSFHTQDFYVLSILTTGFIPNIVHFKHILGQVNFSTARLTRGMINFSSEKHSFISYNVPGITGHSTNTLKHIMSLLSHGSNWWTSFYLMNLNSCFLPLFLPL